MSRQKPAKDTSHKDKILHKDKLLYCEISKGYTFKILIDSLFVAMKRTIFTVTPQGFYHSQADEANHILIDVDFPMRNFGDYHCKTPYSFSLNINHIHKMVKNVKKKDSITMFIEHNNRERLMLRIKPSETTKGSNYKSETIGINIKEETEHKPIMLPESCEHPMTKENVTVYGDPKIVKGMDFQKMKKITTIGKNVDVKMQNNHYICFSNNNGDLYDTEFEYGELVNHASESEEESDEFSIGDMYDASFPVKSFTLLMKLPGLCKQLQFYKPKLKGFPLKIALDATEMGHIRIYLKDSDAIEREQNQREGAE